VNERDRLENLSVGERIIKKGSLGSEMVRHELGWFGSGRNRWRALRNK
jgi:hypothetical protein